MISKCVGQRKSWFDFYDHIECVPTYNIFFLDVEIKFSSIVSQIFRQLYRRIRSYSQCYRIQKLWYGVERRIRETDDEIGQNLTWKENVDQSER